MVYQRTTVDQIQQAIKQFSLEESFTKLTTNEMVFLLNKTIKNIFSNYIPMKQSLVMTEIHLD